MERVQEDLMVNMKKRGRPESGSCQSIQLRDEELGDESLPVKSFKILNPDPLWRIVSPAHQIASHVPGPTPNSTVELVLASVKDLLDQRDADNVRARLRGVFNRATTRVRVRTIQNVAASMKELPLGGGYLAHPQGSFQPRRVHPKWSSNVENP